MNELIQLTLRPCYYVKGEAFRQIDHTPTSSVIPASRETLTIWGLIIQSRGRPPVYSVVGPIWA